MEAMILPSRKGTIAMPQPSSNVVQMPAPVTPVRRKGRLKLTDANVKNLPLQGADSVFGPHEKLPYYDTEVRGFFVLCHRTSKSFYCQHDIAGRSVMVNLGRADTITVKDARKLAMAAIVQMKNGINPNDEKQQRKLQGLIDAETDAFTFRDALNAHLYERKRERSAKTIHNYLNIAETHLADLMDKPMTWLGANQHLIEALHDRVTRRGWDRTKKAGRGRRATCGPAPYSANGAVRLFRAVYKHARVKKSHLKLPEFQPIELNPEHAKDSALSLEQLPVWYDAVMKLPNPIRRDFQLFTLFTGNRSTATSEMMWKDVDLTGAVNGVPSVFVPTPKGGASKAFYVPLSDFLVDLLKARRACKMTNAAFPDSPWVFPAIDSDSQHIEEPTEKRHDLLKHFSPHALRHSYITFAQFAGVNLTDIAFLANQRPKSITVAYMRALLGPLRERQQTITAYIQDHLAK
jgi:integrase